ncbi:MAG TPA: NAD-dependent epimerase/dehydratase family protein [Thermodesulfobacteriota bacterium]
MKVLVTGATGVIGSHLTESLVREGYEVKALARETSYTNILRLPDVEIVYGDINDLQSIERAVKGCHQVYHLAAKTSRSNCSKKEYYSVNVDGTKKVASVALKAGVDRFIYCSTVGVYGNTSNTLVNEDTETNPNSTYSNTKLLGEKAAIISHRRDGLPVVIARISTVLGPRSTNWLKWVQDISKNSFRMVGSGENRIHMVYISDLIDGLKLLGKVSDIEGETYIIAGREPIKIKQFVELIAQELNIAPSYKTLPAFPFYSLNFLANLVYRYLDYQPKISAKVNFFLSNQIFDITKAQNELGYSPKVPLKEGINNTIEWWRENVYI